MAGRNLCSGRRCLSWVVSKVGPSTPRPPSASETFGSRHAPVSDGGSNWNGTTLGVVIGGVVAFVVMIVVLLVLRRKRIRSLQMGRESAEIIAAGKGGQGEADGSKEGQWCAGEVELVVMAGETEPTFLAHPVPTPIVTHVPMIQCPPLDVHLANDQQQQHPAGGQT